MLIANRCGRRELAGCPRAEIIAAGSNLERETAGFVGSSTLAVSVALQQPNIGSGSGGVVVIEHVPRYPAAGNQGKLQVDRVQAGDHAKGPPGSFVLHCLESGLERESGVRSIRHAFYAESALRIGNSLIRSLACVLNLNRSSADGRAANGVHHSSFNHLAEQPGTDHQKCARQLHTTLVLILRNESTNAKKYARFIDAPAL